MEKKVKIIFASLAVILIIVFGSFLLFKDYFREKCGNNRCGSGETEKTCPIDCKKQVTGQPTQEEKELMDKTGLSLDEIRELKKKTPDFFNDDDKDGLVNGMEQEIGTNPNDATSNGETDSDRDGATNLQEYVAGSDPKDSNSKP